MRMSSNRNKPKKASASKPVRKKAGKQVAYEIPADSSPVNEPAAVYTSKIRAIGNSRGVILNSQLMETAGLIPDEDIVIRASDGLITIQRVEKPAVNTNLSTWDKQFKAAIKAGAKPEGDLFEGIENEFDAKEW
jgi:antitoxin component of MazEF toxin-antitoxin module